MKRWNGMTHFSGVGRTGRCRRRTGRITSGRPRPAPPPAAPDATRKVSFFPDTGETCDERKTAETAFRRIGIVFRKIGIRKTKIGIALHRCHDGIPPVRNPIGLPGNRGNRTAAHRTPKRCRSQRKRCRKSQKSFPRTISISISKKQKYLIINILIIYISIS